MLFSAKLRTVTERTCAISRKRKPAIKPPLSTLPGRGLGTPSREQLLSSVLPYRLPLWDLVQRGNLGVILGKD